MIDHQKGTILVECDSCSEVFDGESTNFTEVWNAAKRDGWRTRKIAGEWIHSCGKCAVPT
jgi:frataxin-like iron-binding protein CyaY